MTPRLSARAQARGYYAEMADAAAAPATQETPTPNPSPLLASARGGGERAVRAEGQQVLAAADPEQTSLTARVRALYENSVVPVREIAALAGVTERTIYKYARKQNWKPRYRWREDGARPSFDADRARFAPAKGAGGRYIRRDDAGKPVARGIKATDPAAAARAGDACERAQGLSAQAEAKTESDLREEAYIRGCERLVRALKEVHAYQQEKARAKLDSLPSPYGRPRSKEETQWEIARLIRESRNDNDPFERTMWAFVKFETDMLEKLQTPYPPFAPPQGGDSGTS